MRQSSVWAVVAILGLALSSKASVIWDLSAFTGSAIGVNVVVEDDSNPNTLRITATVTPDGENTVGDLRGIFFTVNGGSSGINANMFSGVGFTLNTSSQVCIGTEITGCGGGDNALNGGGPSNPIPAGSFHVGIEIGTSGIGGGDDFPSAVILFNYGALGLSAEDLGPFGARVTSVGTSASRSGSSKLYGGIPQFSEDETEVPEPSTWLTLSAGLGLLALARIRRSMARRN